jgi:MerR family transcriptional regulator, light-induced transcriptional regulator
VKPRRKGGLKAVEVLTVAEPITLHEAAERLGVHYMTAYRYVRTGRLPARRKGVQWVVDDHDLDRLRGQVHPRPASHRTREDRAATLTARMMAGDEAGAWRIIEDALGSAMEPADAYLSLLLPALRGIGDGWAAGTVTIVQEHRATTIASRIVGRLGPRFTRRGRKRGSVVIGAPAGDLHGLPTAIVADLLRERGFEVSDLGANTPASSFAEAAQHATRLVAVLIGVTTPRCDGAAASAVRELHRHNITAPVLVGGAAVADAGHALRLGADGWTGVDGQAVVAAVDRVAGTPRGVPSSLAPGAGTTPGQAALSAPRSSVRD